MDLTLILQACSINLLAFSSARYLFGSWTLKNFKAPSKSACRRSSFEVWKTITKTHHHTSACAHYMNKCMTKKTLLIFMNILLEDTFSISTIQKILLLHAEIINPKAMSETIINTLTCNSYYMEIILVNPSKVYQSRRKKQIIIKTKLKNKEKRKWVNSGLICDFTLMRILKIIRNLIEDTNKAIKAHQSYITNT